MNVLETAKRQAGKNFASFKVFVPLVFLTAAILAITVFVGYSEKTEWLFSLLVGIVAAIPIACMAGYFWARKNPKVLRQELEGMLQTEQMLLSLERDFVAKMSADFEAYVNDLDASFQKIWRSITQGREEVLEGLRTRLDQANMQTSPAVKILAQEEFIELHRIVVEMEEIDLEKAYQGSLKKFKEISITRGKESVEKILVKSRKEIAEREGAIAEIRSALRGIPS